MAEHDIEKIVEAGGEVFNFRDPTKQPVADRVTSIRAASSATDTNYPTEKAVRTELDAKATDSAVLHKAGLETASGQKWFEGGFCVFNSGHVGYGHFTLAGTSRGSAYNDWTEEQKDGAHFREWSLSFNTGVNFWGKLRITIATPYSSFNASGSMQKTINCAFNTKTVFNNTGYYNDLGINTEKEFRISDLIWNNTTECWEIKIHSIKPTSNNSVPVLLIEFWTHSTTYRESALGIHWVSTSPSIVTDTTYYTKRSGDASTSPGTGGEQFNWADTPVQQSTYGYEIFNRSHTIPVGNGGTGRTSVTAGNYVVGAGTSSMVEKTPKDVGSNVLSSLDDKSNASSYANFVDGDFVVGSDHVDASTISASTFVRRTALNLWNYIKGKLTGSDVNIGGNAVTATKATQDSDGSAINTTYKKLAESSKFTEPQWIDNKTSPSYCDLRIGNSFKLLSVGVSGTGNISIKEIADQRTNSPAQDKSIIYTSNGGTQYNFNGNAATASALADETGFVHTTGNETVGGKKTFTDAEVNSESSSGTYSGFFVKRTAVDDGNKVYRVSLEVSDDGSRGIYDYGGSGLDGENKWIIRKLPDGSITIGESTNINKISIGGITLDFSGSLGNAANTLYFGWAGGGSS